MERMSDLKDFRNNLINQIRNESGISGTSFSEEFLHYVSDLLVYSEELSEDITYSHYEGFGLGGKKKIQLNGYSINEYDECLNLFIVSPENISDEVETLTNDEIKKLFNRCEAFITEAAFICKNAEESHPSYGLATDINKNSYEVKKYRINIVTDEAKTKNSLCLVATKEMDSYSIEYGIIDIERLKQMEDSRAGKIAIEIDFNDVTGIKGIPCMLANETDNCKSYLCNIPGMTLATLYNEYGSRLLEGNVRSFLQQKNKVNKGIRTTILKEPNNFFIYNNGITATAESISVEEDKDRLLISHITGLQIVNGGQTTASLASCLLNDRREGSEESISRISVPMKLTVVQYDKAIELIPSISRYANSQNKVSEADLWSNHPFHVKMEEISRKLATPLINGINGTYWYYERARGQYKQSTYKKSDAEKRKFEKLNPKNQLLKKTDFAKYINIKELHPEYASLGGEKAFFKIASKTKEAWDKNPAVFNESYFKELVSIAILYQEVDLIVKKQGREYKAQINVYTVTFFLYLIETQLVGYHLNYKDIWNRQSVRPIVHDILEGLTEVVYSVLTNSERKVENVTEWAKRELCWTLLKQKTFVLSPELKDGLLNDDEYYEAKKDARKEAKAISQDQAQIEVVQKGSSFWKALLSWDDTAHELNYQDRTLLSTALSIERGKIPRPKDCVLILLVLDKARENGYLV